MMLGDNSPRSKDSRGWDNRDRYDPDYPDVGWDTSQPRELGGPPVVADRQGVLRLLAARQAVRARHPRSGATSGCRSGLISNG